MIRSAPARTSRCRAQSYGRRARHVQLSRPGAFRPRQSRRHPEPVGDRDRRDRLRSGLARELRWRVLPHLHRGQRDRRRPHRQYRGRPAQRNVLGSVFTGYGSSGSLIDSILAGGLVSFNNNSLLTFSGVGDKGLSVDMNSITPTVHVVSGVLTRSARFRRVSSHPTTPSIPASRTGDLGVHARGLRRPGVCAALASQARRSRRP